MASDPGASSISVAVRVRPFTIGEAAQLRKADDSLLFLGDGSLAAAPAPKLNQKGLRSVIKVVDDKCLVFDPPEDNPVQRFSRSVVPQGKRVKDQTFGFDRVFDDNTTQSDVYEATTRGLLDSVLDGYNATVFAYGATGCGKTHTITGTAQSPGIIFLTMQELYEKISELSDEKVVELSLSYLEIYNETIRDLLIDGAHPRGGLMLREDSNQAVSVAGLSSHHPKNVQEVMDMIVRGNELRTMSPTAANATSSRSHAVLQINVSQKDRNADISEPHTMATLSIIDLAGSERASATKNRGERLIEGANINKSLLALGSCINALCDPRKRNHVPYRNSKLTRLLKFSLGGNCKTVMIVCVSPSSAHFDETQNTLRYANRAKNIQTKVTRNVYNVNRHVKDFLKKIDEQMAMINELKQQQKEAEQLAFAKFRRLGEKREVVLREGVARLRAAYEHSTADRQARIKLMRGLRSTERRISMVSAWIAGFETVCDSREDEEPPKQLAAMRQTAQQEKTNLEDNRHHFHKMLAKCNWERAVDTALQTGLRQLSDCEGVSEETEMSSLRREAELLKHMADREAHTALQESEKTGDAATVQILLQAHFETVAILDQIMSMSEEEATQAARSMLGKIVTSCCTVSGQIIKPDGKLPIVEMFPPMKGGTPKQRKAVNLLGPSPIRPLPRPDFAELEPTIQTSSPSRASPRRRKLGPAKKGISFTPKKKSPIKGLRRGVRWRDDEEDGRLADFQATPQPIEPSPEVNTTTDLPSPPAPPAFSLPNFTASIRVSSSPIATPPEISADIRPKNSRFQTGFLSKKADGSPLSSQQQPPTSTLLSYSSDSSTTSPLREVEPNRGNAGPRPSTLRVVSTGSSPDTTPAESYNNTSDSENEDPLRHSTKLSNKSPRISISNADKSSASHKKPSMTIDPREIRSALKRRSSTRESSGHHHAAPRTSTTQASSASAHRRRSPTGSGSPPSTIGEGLFSASAARRMVRNERTTLLGEGEWKAGGVLSPRTAPIMKNTAREPVRRTTMAVGDVLGSGGAMRGSAVRPGSAGNPVGSAVGSSRGSLMPGGKSAWR